MISFGVVPLAMREWKPEIAPQAMVMKTNGNTLPPNKGPVPSMNGVSAGILSIGWVMTMASPSSSTVPIFRNVDR